MKHGMLETVVGFAVIIAALMFFVFGYNASNSSKARDGYILVAQFQNVEGLAQGGEVKIAGVKIGYIDQMQLDNKNFVVNVFVRLDKNIKIPKDSKISVATSGLMGGKYLSIDPGAEDEVLAVNDRIKFTQSAVNFEELVSKLVYSITTK